MTKQTANDLTTVSLTIDNTFTDVFMTFSNNNLLKSGVGVLHVVCEFLFSWVLCCRKSVNNFPFLARLLKHVKVYLNL